MARVQVSSTVLVSAWIVILVHCGHIAMGHSYTIVLTTLPANSHCREVAAIGKELKDRGHRVIFFMPDFYDMRKCQDAEDWPKSDLSRSPTHEHELAITDTDSIDCQKKTTGDEPMYPQDRIGSVLSNVTHTFTTRPRAGHPVQLKTSSPSNPCSPSSSFHKSPRQELLIHSFYIPTLTFKTEPEFQRTYLEEEERIGRSFLEGNVSPLDSILSLHKLIQMMCDLYLSPRMREKLDALHKELGVDFMIIDGVFIGQCLALLPAYLRVPFALVSSIIDPFVSAEPIPTASYPFIMSALPGKMNLAQRVANAGNLLFMQLLGTFISFSISPGSVLGPEFSGAKPLEYMKKGQLFLENSDFIADYPRATFPNFIQVGGLTARPAKLLPETLQRFFDEAKPEGVVVFSLGSQLDSAPPGLTAKFVSAMNKVRARVVLRLSLNSSDAYVSKHVKNVAWFPQNDALGHPNTRVFVSHCGKNGFFEALYHGVPIVCTPLYCDGYGTAQRVSEFGIGLSVNVFTATDHDIARVINSVLDNPSFSQNMRRLSKFYHQRSERPAQRAAAAIEYVLAYGADHLRPMSADLNPVSYSGIDVAIIFCLLALAFFAVGLLLLYLMLRLSVWVLRTLKSAFNLEVKSFTANFTE